MLISEAIAKDGEGATKLLTCQRPYMPRQNKDAQRLSLKSVITSSLVESSHVW